MAKGKIKVDGVSINTEHFANHKEADFVAEIKPALALRFGTDAQQDAWAKNAFKLMQKAAGTAKEEKK